MENGNNLETEFKELNETKNWPAHYLNIRAKSLKQSGTCSEALKPQNKTLNRYRDVHPYDHSRIILQRGSTDYINANLCKVEKAKRKYILTQGPLPNTIGHFWLMVWEQKSKAVLMLNKLVEKKQEKCSQYWPSKVGEVLNFQDVGLKLEYLEQQDHSYYLTRVLRLTDTESDKSRDILQFHYITWPDFGVPCSPIKFLDFLRKVRKAGVLEEDVGPAVIHCSAGIGRSGTFCLVDSCLVLIEKYGLNSVNVEEVLLEMRKYRIGLIQTAEQLRFSYQAIIEGAKQILNPNYEEESETNHVENNLISDLPDSDESDETPPKPPPRDPKNVGRGYQNGTGEPFEQRPLPPIPASVSVDDLTYNDNKSDSIEEKSMANRPLPALPSDDDTEEEDQIVSSSESSLVDEDGTDDERGEDVKSPLSESLASDKSDASKASAELRHRRRVERKHQMEQQVRDMKRRQEANEQWTQLKRSLLLPIVLGGSLFLGGGVLAYFYFKQ